VRRARTWSAVAAPPLVLAAHGSPHPAHAPSVLALGAAVAADCPGSYVGVGWLGFAEPALADAARLAAAHGHGPVAVVPLLLTDGFHARVDVPHALAGQPWARSHGALGPHPLLAAAVQRRLVQAGAVGSDPVVLAAAGSGEAAARRQCAQVAQLLAELRDAPVRTAYATGSGGTVADAVAAVRAGAPGRPVFVATYLLGPGALADRVARQARAAGAQVSAPLGTAPEVVALVRERWLGPTLGAVSRAAPALA
jgi:sirohydrochlorin ferrochelatase